MSEPSNQDRLDELADLHDRVASLLRNKLREAHKKAPAETIVLVGLLAGIAVAEDIAKELSW
jgi:hypothetical protein